MPELYWLTGKGAKQPLATYAALKLPTLARYPGIVREAEQERFGYEELLRRMTAELRNRPDNAETTHTPS